MDEKEFDYMNVIPLVDVMLVLLTIVLTTSTFIVSGGLPVELPRATAKRDEMRRPLTIEIDRQGGLFLNSRAVPLGSLREHLQPLDRETPVLIRADRDVVLQSFVDVLDIVKNSDFRRVSLQTEERK